MSQRNAYPKLYRARSKEERRPFRFDRGRDPEILKAHFDYRILNSDQLASLVVHRLPTFVSEHNGQTYTNTVRGVKDRLRGLIDLHHIKRPWEQAPVRYMKHQAAMTMLDYTGGAYLINEHGYDPKEIKKVQKPLSSTSIPHEIGLSGARLVFELGLPQIGFHLATWKRASNTLRSSFEDEDDDGELKRFVINPDGFFYAVDQGQTEAYFFFIEYDRGNISGSRMKERYLAYSLFLQNQLHHEEPYNVTAKSLRIITVFEDDDAPQRSSKRDHVDDMKKWVREVVPKKYWGNFWFLRASEIHRAHDYTVKENGNPVIRKTERYVPEAITRPVFETLKHIEPQMLLVPKEKLTLDSNFTSVQEV